MLLNLLYLALGLGLLLAGGEALVRGSVALARRLGVPTLIVGLTVVALGTSAPELVVNLIAASRGQSDIGFGNVVGSNIVNLTLLLGVTALIRPVVASTIVVRREIPMMLLTAVAALILAEDVLLNGRPGQFDRDDGLMLLLLFSIYLYYLISDAVNPSADKPSMLPTDAVEDDNAGRPAVGLPVAILLVVGGLGALIGGGQLTVTGATALAQAFGVPDTIIALTLVAIGTSLPELVTCITAARRGETDLALGNLVGSCVYNLTFVFGLTATIDPIGVPDGGIIDLSIMLVISALALPLALTGRTFSRIEGALLLVIYAGYLVFITQR